MCGCGFCVKSQIRYDCVDNARPRRVMGHIGVGDEYLTDGGDGSFKQAEARSALLFQKGATEV